MLLFVMRTTADSLLSDSLLVPECVYRPGTFSALMTIYESNYLKLERLLEGLELAAETWMSAGTHDCDLHLKLLRSERYTTTFKMTYWFDDAAEGLVADPDLIVRIYHDAGLAEGCGGRHSHQHRVLQELERVHRLELDRRWQTNIMLNKWLDYVLQMGHRFEPQSMR